MKHTALEIYQMASGRWQWRLIAPNGEKLARGSQARGFSTNRAAWDNMAKTAVYLSNAPVRMPSKADTTLGGLRIKITKWTGTRT